MQLIRAYQVLRFLCNFPLVCRQQLRADRRFVDILQHLAQRHGFGMLCFILHQIAHQRLGDGGIYAVHRHLIAVVCGPAQRQFRQIARTYDQAFRLVGQVHQYLRAFTGLRIFIHRIANRLFMADVLKMASHGARDLHGAECHAQRAA